MLSLFRKKYAPLNPFLTGIFLSLLPAAGAQTPAKTAEPPNYRSPEVTAPGEVTVRFYSPNAQSVSVEGDWDNWTKHPLSRDPLGLWSVKLGPFPPDLYEYRLRVDGLPILDPKNAEMRPFQNRVEIPGTTPLFIDPQPGARGTVRAEFYPSKAARTVRRVHVYTPPGYEDASRTRYPVLVLLHGSGDDDESWASGLGRANVILDNLIRRGEAVPMIVVMPNGHVDVPGKTLTFNEENDLFEKDLLEDVLPLVDKHYRTLPRRESRAICGLSMGGGQTVTVGMKHPEVFSAFGVFSAGIWNGAAPQFETAVERLAQQEKSLLPNAPRPLIWIGIGKQDFLYTNYEALTARLREAKLPFTSVETRGGHVWFNWRDYLHQFAPLLFHSR